MSIGDGILVGLAALALVPVAVLAVETLAAFLPLRRRTFENCRRPNCAVLVPAHNEEIGIAATVAALRLQLLGADRLVVIADNCTDGTVAAAREAGAEVVERNDPERRGKGYALDFGLRHIEASPPDIVVCIDADTRALPGSIEFLIRTAQHTNQPTQGAFTDSPKMRGPREQWSAFALTLKNLVRPRGLDRLGLPCLLTGSGMAFPWSVIRKVGLANGSIVEDMHFGVDLALAGHPPVFCGEARFESDDAPTAAAMIVRRTRWEHGHVSTLLGKAPRLLLAGLIGLRPRLAALALELSVPPLSLLLLLLTALLAISLGWFVAGGSPLPALMLSAGLLAGAASVVAAWWKFGRALLAPTTLFLLPVYVLWKVPIYLRLATAPERKWVRTQRSAVA
jgi:cellulose synthase/poly-beta-1,6-N-acetylglucosamine synthase-like glycosyltransferase